MNVDGEVAFEAGFYWVLHGGQVRIAEWCDMGSGWEWSFTRAEVAQRVDRILGKAVTVATHEDMVGAIRLLTPEQIASVRPWGNSDA